MSKQDNLNSLQKDLRNYITSEILIGNNSNRRIYPDGTPQTTLDENLSEDEKIEALIKEPKFGMFSLNYYILSRNLDEKKKTVFCTNVFTKKLYLPILIFVSQWLLYVSIMNQQIRTYEDGFCPNSGSIETKLIMCGIAIFYFANSFFIWDDLVVKTHLKKVMPTKDIFVLIDIMQEFSFNLLVYMANMFIIFISDDPVEILLNSLAMEFLMELDNQFKEKYFSQNKDHALDIYDNIFVSRTDNRVIFQQKLKENKCFYCFRGCCYIPFKILLISLMVFPLFCFIIIFYGPICK